MILLHFLHSLFARKPGVALRQMTMTIPSDTVRSAGYVASFSRSGSWPFNQQ